MEKYKHLRKLEQDISQFIARYKKEYSERLPKNELRLDIIKFINKLELNDGIYLDIINLICDEENDFSSKILLNEIKRKIVNNTFYKDYIISDVYSDECNIVNFLRKKMDNFSLLTEPVIYLFSWYNTLKSTSFYASLNRKIRKKLILFEELCL